MDDSGFDLSDISNVAESRLMIEDLDSDDLASDSDVSELDINDISVNQDRMDSMDSIGVESEAGSLSGLDESFDAVVDANDPDETSLHKIRLRF